VRLAAEIAARCYRAPKPVPVRTLDGLHLATAVLPKCRAVATADRRMQAAAALLRVPLLCPGV
jgi:predicted nucleic acid-binding protein